MGIRWLCCHLFPEVSLDNFLNPTLFNHTQIALGEQEQERRRQREEAEDERGKERERERRERGRENEFFPPSLVSLFLRAMETAREVSLSE